MPLERKRVVPPAGQIWPVTWLCFSDVFVGLFQAGDCPDSLWRRFMADLNAPTVKRVMGSNVGPISVSSTQRKDLFESVRGKKVTAVLDNRIAIGIATALRWLGLEFNTYSWHELPRAMEDLLEGNAEAPIPDSVALIKDFMAASNVPNLNKLLKPPRADNH